MFVGHLPDTHVLCSQEPRLTPRSFPALEVVSELGSEHQARMKASWARLPQGALELVGQAPARRPCHVSQPVQVKAPGTVALPQPLHRKGGRPTD